MIIATPVRMVAEKAEPTSDEEWAARIVRGDRAALVELVHRYHERVTRLARRLLNRADVDDVAQETYVAVLENVHRFRGECQFATWLTRIVINQCRMRQRWSRRFWNWWLAFAQERGLALNVTEHNPHPMSTVQPAFCSGTLAHDAGDLQRALAQLPTADREVLVLRYFEAQPVIAIADILGLTRGAVDTRLNRARGRLKTLLTKRNEDMS
jgi:RNA polymerase sigma-70 factor (ECF subfamily)